MMLETMKYHKIKSLFYEVNMYFPIAITAKTITENIEIDFTLNM